MKITAAALLAGAVLSLAACGGQSTTHHTAKPSATTVEPSAATAAASAPASEPVLTCADLNPALRAVIADMRKQNKLNRVAHVSSNILSGAWTPPGTYSGDLKDLFDAITSWAEANTSASEDDIIIDGLPSSVTSQPAQLASDVNALYDAGGWVYDGPGSDRWGDFKASVKALTADCKR
jgi:hypothetical protein